MSARKAVLVFAAFVFMVANIGAAAALGAERPNVVIFLADDLGYSDLGCYGSEIQTPNLDELAKNGLRFTQFYNTARCWPTRSALLTGYYAQQIRRDTIPGVPSGGGGKRPAWARLLPEMLKPLGYRSYHSGKWHLDGMPLAGGFDHSYYLGDEGRYFRPRKHWENDQLLPAIEPNTSYYSTTVIADHAINYLKEHASQHSGKPFFEYVAFTAPHFPLQALPEDIERYKGKYRRGWEEIRQERWQKMHSLKIADGTLSKFERNLGPPWDHPEAIKALGPGETDRPLPWSVLNDVQQDYQATKMAIHAAMVDRIDQEIGRVLAQLREMNAFENTLILFLSDNGASAEIMVRDDGHDPSAPPGSSATHLCLGPGWSTTSNTPFRRHKVWVHEGGISTPLIAHWPRGISNHGELRRNAGHVIDIVPTVLEVAGGKPFDKWDGKPVPNAPGKSLVRAFTNDNTVSHDYFWWFHTENRAIRIGDWKLVASGNDAPWELYDLKTDRAESNNLAKTQPAKATELEQAWNQHLKEFRTLATQDLPANK